MLFTNKVAPSSAFSSFGTPTTGAWSSLLSKPNPPSISSTGVPNASMSTLFTKPAPLTSANQSILFNPTSASSQSLLPNTNLSRNSNNNQLFQSQSAKTPSFGLFKQDSTKTTGDPQQQGKGSASLSSNVPANSISQVTPPNSQPSSGLFSNLTKPSNMNGLFNPQSTSLDTNKLVAQGNGLFSKNLATSPLFSLNSINSQNNGVKPPPPQSSVFASLNNPTMSNKPSPPPVQSTQPSMFSNLLNKNPQPTKPLFNNTSASTTGPSNLWQMSNNTQPQDSQKPGLFSWKNEHSANNQNAPQTPLFSLSTQTASAQTKQQGQTTLFNPTTPFLASNNQGLLPQNSPLTQPVGLNRTVSFGPITHSTNNNNKNGLPFSWTSSSRTVPQVFKPKQGAFTTALSQPASQWSFSSGTFQPKTSNTNAMSIGSHPRSESSFSFGVDLQQSSHDDAEAEFFKRLEARVSSNKENVSSESGVEFPYNPFEVSSSFRSHYRSNDSVSDYHQTRRSRRNLEEDGEYEYGCYKTKKELIALNHSRDLVRMLKTQGNKRENKEVASYESDESQVSRAESVDMIVYVMFLADNESERTIAVDVSNNSTCLELKKAVLKTIFGNDSTDLESFKLHRDGQLLEQDKKLSEIEINALEYVVLEKVDNSR